MSGLVMDMADARILRGLLDGLTLSAATSQALHQALAAKDGVALDQASLGLPDNTRAGLRSLLDLYGGAEVLAQARACLPRHALIDAALADLGWLAEHLQADQADVSISFDLADLSGYEYYSGARFALYARGGSAALLRGGRYDDVGAVFGRSRPAVGFSLDLKPLAELTALDGRRAAVRAPWGEQTSLRAAVQGLREQGDTVVRVLPGHEHETDEFDCDRELVAIDDCWVVRAL
jgi:ATP phosphoribosyltransferase regulatory subunit